MATEEEKLVERLRAHGALIAHYAADTISRVVRERDEAQELAQLFSQASRKPDWIARATAAEARVAQLETALKPFADAADSIDDDTPDRIEMWEHPASMQVTAADFRRARTALSQSPDRESGT